MTPNNDTHQTSVYDVVLVGGGIAGMATAIGLMRRGITNILVLEKSSTMHPVGASIAIFSNGLKALDYISPTVAKKVRDSCIPIETMIVKDLEGNLIRDKKPPSRSPVSYMVWYLLQQYLAEELPDGILRLGCTVQSFQVGDTDNIVTITASSRMTATANQTIAIRARVLVGTDGIHSPIREQLFGTVNKMYHDKVMYRAVLPKSTVVNPPPTGINVTFQGDERGKLFSYRETSPDILTVTAFARSDEQPLVPPPEENKEQMLQVFKDYPDEVQNVLRQLSPQAIHVNAVQDIDVLDGGWSKGPVIVIGDAAHAMSPAMGQGANQGLESACVLVHLLVKELNAKNDDKSSINSVLDKVYQSRIKRVTMIHAASRARSMSNNQSSKSSPIDMNSMELKRVLEEIDSWDAPVDE